MIEQLDAPAGMDERAVVGHSLWLPARIAGPLYFVTVTPCFVYLWFTKPRFIQGPIDFPEIFMAIVTVLMVSLGCYGVLAPFLKTKATLEGFEWRAIRRQRLRWDEISHVERIVTHNYGFIPLVSVMRVRTHHGRRVDVPGGTNELYQLFRALENRYPCRD